MRTESIRAIRKSKGVSQEELAAECGATNNLKMGAGVVRTGF